MSPYAGERKIRWRPGDERLVLLRNLRRPLTTPDSQAVTLEAWGSGRWPLRREGRVRWAVVSNEVLSLQDRLPAGACQQRHELDERKITIPLKSTYSSRHAEPVCLDNPNKHDADRGPTLSHHWFNISCLMGRSDFWMIRFDNVFYQGI